MKDKNQLRQEFKNARDVFVGDKEALVFESDFQQCFERFVQDQRLDLNEKIVACYEPFGSEASPRGIIRWLFEKNIEVALPQMNGKSLVFSRYTRTMLLVKNHFNFFEPVEKKPLLPDIVILPLLAFDEKGHRLGYGQGHYDRALEEILKIKRPMLIGLSYPCQKAASLPAEPHDQKLDAVLLPKASLLF